MTPSPEHSPHQPTRRPRRSWRYPLVATAVSAALVLSPLATQAFADDQLPGDDATSSTAPADPSTPKDTPSSDSSTPPASEPADDTSDTASADAPSNNADSSTSTPETKASPHGTKPSHGSDAAPPAPNAGANAVGGVSPSQQWATSVSTISGPSRTLTFGTSGVSTTQTAVSSSNCSMVNSGSSAFFTTPNAVTYIEPDAPVGATAAGMQCSGQTAPGTGVTTLTFSKPVINPIFSVINLDASRFTIAGTSTTGAPISLTALAKNNALEINGTTVNDTPQNAINGGCMTDAGANVSGGCGSLMVTANSGAIQTLTLTNTTANSGLTGAAASDGWAFGLSFPTAPLTKAFNPTTIASGGVSQLTFTIANPDNVGQGTLAPLDFTDNLPAGVTIANGTVSDNGSCGTPTLTDPAGGSLDAGDAGVKAAAISVAQGVTCTITVNVTSDTTGSYTNDNSNLSTSVANLVPNANATLTVTGGPDFGDAPTPYGTTLANNGPRHGIKGYDATTHTASLMLGTNIDDETDGIASAGADGDDTASTDDEDGLTALTVAPGATTATGTVAVTNSTGKAATLFGWIDANGNGSFQASEATTVAVPAGATSATLSWTGLPSAIASAKPIVRLRLTTATLTDTTSTAGLDERSQGAALDGEVEDHPVQVTPPLTSCTAAQVRATQRYWYFGNAAALDFGPSFDTPQRVTGVGTTPEGSTVVTDTSGNLQFWSNADTIYNRNGQPMLNGTGLTGSFSATQTVSAFPAPGRPGFYFVVTTSANHTAGQLRYSEVDMSLDGGLGGVVTGRKNLNLGTATAFEDIQAVPNADGTGYWVLTSTAGTGNVLAYAFDGNGPVTGTPVVTPLPNVLAGTAGYHRIQVSPDGSQLLLMSGDSAVDRMWLLDFDGATGRMYPRVSWTGGGTGNRAYGADFSPSGKYVYVSYIDGGQLLRWDIASYTTQAQLEAHPELVIDGTGSGGQVRRSPDGRMIWVNDDSISSLSVLTTPDDPAGAGLVTASISLAPATTVFGLPEFVTGCPVPKPSDYGDAPASYATTDSANGARHELIGYDASAHTASLMLGAQVDDESSGVPAAAANGDDLAGTDDEDAGTVQVTTGSTTAAVTVPVVNGTGSAARLYGWIDANGNGTFQANEAATAVVADGDTDATLSWSGLTAIAGTAPVVRLRLTTATLVDTAGTASLDERSQGPAPDGEVEDSLASVVPPAVCDGSAYPVVAAGGVSDLFRVSPDGTTISHVADIAYDLNAIGYNQADGFLYGWRRTTGSSPFNQLVRINPTTGAVALLGTVVGTPASGWTALAAMNGNVMYLNAVNSLYTVDVSTKTITSTKAVVGGWPNPTPADIAFNPLDGFLYGYAPISATTGRVVKIDPATGVTTSTDFTQPAAANASWGGQWMDGSGRLYGLSNTDQTLWRIDGVGTASPTIAKVVQGSGATAGGDAASCTPPDLLKDVSPRTVSPGGTVTYTYTVSNPTLSALTGVGVTDVLPNDSAKRTFTGAVTVSGGGLPLINWNYTIGNTNRAGDTLTLTGMTIPSGGRAVVTAVVQVAPTAASGTVTNQAELTGLSNVFARTLSDYPPTGAIDDPTPLVIQAFDRGDAPASFTTTQAQNGPAHSLGGYDAVAHTSSLMLGAQVDDDTDGVPGATATGDDAAGVDDEDALASFSIAPGATTATATVPVVNTTGAAATLYGFIDTNGNGTYQTSEAATVAVPNGATSATLSWTGLPPAVDGSEPVVRLRLTSGNLTDNVLTLNLDDRSQGPAPDGEVEDSLAAVAAVLPNDCSNPLVETFGAGAGRASLPAGQTTYTYAATGAVNDGSYALVPGIDTSYGGWWHTGPDHTIGDTNGRAMLINAAFAAGKFFSKSFTGLQVGSEYDFSAWITNANNAGSAILPNVKFQVIDPATGTVLATIDTGNLPNQASLIWTRYALSFTATQSTVRLELINNAPGGGGNDLALDDVGIGPVCEYGDAPNSYGTLLASDGPVHAKGAPRLGATVDYEGDGIPSAAADGDDTTGTPDDEDGVTFNPALAYPNPTIRTGTDPITLLPVQNTVRVNASAPGFASIWVDWNEDGDFADAGERVTDAQAVTAGDNDLTFPGAANPNDIRTYVRVRYSTDAASIHAPGGAAPDGEVEDHQVLVERLTVPSACAPVTQPFYAMTFKVPAPADVTNTSARYRGVMVVRGQAVDMLLTATAGIAAGTITASGDDASWNLTSGGSTTIDYSFFLEGTNTPIQVNGVWSVNDMDNTESTVYRTSEIAGYAITPGSKVNVVTGVTSFGPSTVFRGTVDGVDAIQSRYQVWFQNRSAIRTSWGGFPSSGFKLDGDGDVAVPPSCEDYGDAPDTYKTVVASDGPRHAMDLTLRLGAEVEFDGDGQPTPGADGDDLNRTDDEDGVAAPITQSAGQATTVQVSATNSTASAATLAGWIDLNRNGTFDPAERVTVAVPASSGTATYPLTFPVSSTNSDTYARFRLFPGSVANPLPTGAATAGEVEDYTVTGNVPVVTCATDAALFNTAYNGAGGKTAVGLPDRNWQVAVGNSSGPTSAGAYIPAWVVAGNPAWYQGTFGNASWISYYSNSTQVTSSVDLYFRYTFRIDPEVSLTGFALPMEFFADNSVPDVWVNGTSQDAFEAGLPQSAGAPYTYAGFLQANKAATSLSHGFQIGLNTIVVRVASNSPAVGFMAQINAQALCTDRGDAPDTYGTTGVTGASHGLAGYDSVADTTPLMLGSKVDAEADGVPGAAATGDDTAGIDDEDGVSSPLVVTKGTVPSVTVTATNTGAAPATLAGWIDLDKSGTFDANERAVGSVAPLTTGGTVTLTFAGPVTTSQTTYARFRLYGGVATDPLPSGAVAAGEVEDYQVTTLVPSVSVAKTSDATASSKPGDTVNYTVTLTNTGAGDFTAGNPARLVDDLTDVLDDASYQGDAAAAVDGAPVTAPTYAAPRVSWSGPLAAGKAVVVTYSVVLQGGGDGHVRNTAFAPPGTNPDPPTPDCSAPGAVPCETESFELPKLSITKTANRTALPSVGQTIVYTVTVTNTGLGAFTAGHPATFSDDLSAVLDDTLPLTAGNITATTGTASFTSPTLSWTGALPAGQSATITYTLTYTGLGNQVLVNNACVPLDEAADPADACRTVSVPGSGLRHHKSVDPASGTPVQVGQVLTYTLTFENVGPVAATVDTSDDLSEVLDDAQLVGTPVAGPGLTAAVAGNQLEITGSVPAGQTRTVTYQVEVRPWAAQGDHVLANVLACEPGEPAGCAPEETTNPVRHLTLTKTSDATVDSQPGDTVTYTVTATNDGTGDWTAIDPTTVVDDLSGLLDDATYGGDATASVGADPTYAAPRLTWTGALAHGDTVTIEYTVTLTGGGDGHVDNVVWQPGPGGPGPSPDCATSPLPCAEHGSDLPKLTIKKTSNRAQLPAAGQKITYTVTVTNPGPGDYTAAHLATFTDDLADVLDDATFDAGSETATLGTVALNGTDLEWSGALTAGQSAIVTYTLTYQASGNLVVDNHACIPLDEAEDPADACRTVHTPGSGLRHFKSVDPATGTSVVEGQVLTYTLTFENVGPAAATVDTFDDLSDVADDATLVAGSVNADAGLTATPNGAGDRIDITGSVPTGDSLTVTYQVTVKAYADQGDHVVTNALACEAGDPQPCDPTSTTNPVRHLTLTKTSDATVDSKPGDTVSYTVRLVNDGAGDYTAADPAFLVDDLTEVLDDASFNGVAHASAGPDPTYVAPRITWSGPLASGDEVRVTYEVVLEGGGDGNVDNVAWAPTDPTDPGPTPNCSAPATTVPCSGESFDLPKLVITKDASETELTATGQTVTYTVVVNNPGPGDYTAAHPASFGDDLSDVVDDAEIDPASVTATSGTATLVSPLLLWTGVLTAGQSATIEYTATYRATGNHVLDNTACVPADEARSPAERCDDVQVTGSALTHAKSVAPASGTAVEVGDVLTYTLTFDNSAGTTAATVDTSDDLSDVLDDATLDTGSITAGAGLNAVPSGNNLNITGTVPAGATRTVTYQVTVKPFDQQGDHVLENALACEPGDPTPCDPETTTNPVAHLVIDKTSNRTADSKPGDTITYTVTGHNDGPGDFTAADQASVVDDLSGVLDDADYNNDAAADRPTAPTYADPRITWSGALVSNDTVTITYTVVLKGGGDGVVRNVAWQPVDPGNPGPTPDCAASPRPCDTSSFDLPKLTVAKSASRPDLPATGQDVTYTVVVTNPGPGDYTAAHPATFSDDLSDVLDDATLVGTPTATVGSASVTGTTLSWSGVLAAGGSATITYTFTYRATGDHVLDNTACVPVAEAQVAADACDTVSVPGSALVHAKSVSPGSGTAVEVGDVLTYTLTFDNTAGQAAATVDTTDDLSDVLDDATLDAASITAGAGLTATPTGTDLVVTGSVPAGATRTVTYQVTVKPYAAQGDHVITNALACEPGEPVPCAPETTSNPVRHLVLTKVKTSPVAPDTGDTVSYTLTVHNDGAGDWTVGDPASVVDDLSGVLDDATWNNTAAATAGSVSFASPTLTWSGALAHGATVTITYGVTVTNQGDHQLANTASVPGCQLPECTPPVVVTPLPHVVPTKTSTPATGQPVQPGEVVTYRLSWTNDGTAPGVVDSTDDLSGVLDDAVMVTEPTSSDPAVTATRTGNLLRVVGPIADGDTVTVTYQVRVKPSGQHGDNNLANVLAQDTPQVTCPPFPCTPVPPPTTTHAVGDLDDWKNVDPAAGTPVKAGRQLTYTLHFASVGTGPVTVAREDDLSGVLDDATLVAGPASSTPALTVTGPTAGRIAVTGTLPAGANATVTYTVQVKHDGQRGDDQLGNFLLDPGQQPPSSCTIGTGTAAAAARSDCTRNQVVALEFDLKLDKKVLTDTTAEVGDTVRYGLRVTNRGPDTAPAPIVLRDRLPAGLELISARGKGWDCTAKKASDVVVCHRDEDLAAGKSAPKVTVVAKIAQGASGQIVNKAKVKAAGDTSPANNQDAAPITVDSVTDLPHTGFRVQVPRMRFDW